MSPGRSLKQWVLANPGTFTFTFEGDVDQVFEMSAVLDENDNGACDEGEPTTYVTIGGIDDLADVRLMLDSTSCPARL